MVTKVKRDKARDMVIKLETDSAREQRDKTSGIPVRGRDAPATSSRLLRRGHLLR